MNKQVKHAFAVATLGIFFVINWLFTTTRNLIWWCNGKSADIHQRQQNWQSIPQHAHKMKILVPYIVDPLFPIDERNFLMTHEAFVKPEYVLRDNISLLQVKKTYALFVQQDRTMAPAFSSKYNFAMAGQLITGRYIIKMPIESFLKLAEELECEEEKIILIHNIGRCGGTLLTSCFDHTGRAVAWCEPRVLDNVLRLSNYAWDRETSRRLIRCTFKMLAKPYHGFHDTTLAYIIKVCTFLNGDNKDICNAVPKAKTIFIYRDMNLAARSAQRAMWLVPFFFIFYLSKWAFNPQSVPFFFHILGSRSKGIEDISYRYDLFLEYAYRLQISSFEAFNRMRECGIPVTAVRYEDLIREPDRLLTELMKAFNMPESLASEAKQALKVDSQASQAFSQKEMVQFRKYLGGCDPNEESLRDEMQAISEEFGVSRPQRLGEKSHHTARDNINIQTVSSVIFFDNPLLLYPTTVSV